MDFSVSLHRSLNDSQLTKIFAEACVVKKWSFSLLENVVVILAPKVIRIMEKVLSTITITNGKSVSVMDFIREKR